MDDLILFNANVMTMDAAMSRAAFIAVRDGIIVEIGNARKIGQASGSARYIDCGGRTVLPGFIDAHCHVQAYAENLVSVNLSPGEGFHSIREMQERIREYAARRAPGAWIRGKGYNEFYLAEGRHPTRQDLDAATSLHPVKLTHRSGHAHVLNSLALEQVGITAQTGDPDNGLIDRDLDRAEPTGVLYGMGGYLAARIPPLARSELREGISFVNERLLSRGITSVQDASSYNDLDRWRQFEAWKMQGTFKPRLSIMAGMQAFDAQQGGLPSTVMDASLLRSGGIKIIVHEVTGRQSPGQEALNGHVREIHEAGLQVMIHAVEEKAVEAACNAIEYALRCHPRKDHRHRIEHCSLCPPHLVDRMGDLGIAVVTQPPFIYYSGDRYLKTVPREKHAYLYPFGSLLRKGLIVGASSDFPIADPDPLVGVYAAVTRRSEEGRVIGAGEGVTAVDAIKMYTVFAAASNFEEKMKGSISPGKAADLVVLSDDPLRVNARCIKDIKVEMTILGGEVVYRRDAC